MAKPLTPQESRVLVNQLVETVTSKSTLVPAGLRLEAARRLILVQRFVNDFLDLIGLEMQDQLDEPEE